MDDAELDARVAEARVALHRGFNEFLRAHGLERLERHCSVLFQVDARRQQYVFQVSCAEELKPGDADSAVDPDTGERAVLLCVTPRSLPVYQARSSFAAPLAPQLDWTGDVAALRRALDAGTLAVDERWVE